MKAAGSLFLSVWLAVPAHDRCNLLSVVATMVGVLEHVVGASDLSLQVNAAPADGGQ
jgi:hypothetical protein